LSLLNNVSLETCTQTLTTRSTTCNESSQLPLRLRLKSETKLGSKSKVKTEFDLMPAIRPETRLKTKLWSMPKG